MLGNADKPIRVQDFKRMLERKNPNDYFCLGGSVSCIDGKGGKLANRLAFGSGEITIYFEDETKLDRNETSEDDECVVTKKAYKTWEALKELSESPSKVFKNTKGQLTLSFDSLYRISIKNTHNTELGLDLGKFQIYEWVLEE